MSRNDHISQNENFKTRFIVIFSYIILIPILPLVLVNWIEYKKKIKDNPFHKSIIVRLIEKYPIIYELSILFWNFPLFSKIYNVIPEPKGKVLQVGCGTGLLNKRFDNKKGTEFFNLDLNLGYLRYGLKRKRFSNFLHENIYSVSVQEEYFDMIIFARCFHHIKSHRKAFAECERVLREYGRIIIIDPIGLFDNSTEGFMTNTSLDGIVWCFNPISFKKKLESSIGENLRVESLEFIRQPHISNYNFKYPHTDVVVILSKSKKTE